MAGFGLFVNIIMLSAVGLTTAAEAPMRTMHTVLDDLGNQYVICGDESGYLVTFPDQSRSIRAAQYSISQVMAMFGLSSYEAVEESGRCDWPGGPRCQNQFCDDYDAKAMRKRRGY